MDNNDEGRVEAKAVDEAVPELEAAVTVETDVAVAPGAVNGGAGVTAVAEVEAGSVFETIAALKEASVGLSAGESEVIGAAGEISTLITGITDVGGDITS